jgi:hypothetical protein
MRTFIAHAHHTPTSLAGRRSSRPSPTAPSRLTPEERAACLADYGRRVLSLSAGK